MDANHAPSHWKVLLCESSPNWGGQEFRMVREALWLSKHGHRVLVVCGAGSRLAAMLPGEAPGIRFQTVPSWKCLRGLVRFLAIVRQWMPDVIHVHSGRDALFAMIPHLTGKTVVRSRHITVPVQMPSQRKITYRFGCSRLIASADFIRRDLVEIVGVSQDRVDVIGEGVDCAEFHPGREGIGFRAEFGIPKEAPLFGLIAMIRSEKGHACFIKAAARVVETIPGARFMIVGDGRIPLMTKLRKMVSERFPGKSCPIIFTGYRKDVPEVMAALDTLVVPSFHEAQSLVIPQAFATGKPVVASCVGGIPEIVEHGKTGLLVPPGDVPGFSSAMLRLAESPDLRMRLGGAALDFARRELVFDDRMRLLLRCYRKALHPSACRGSAPNHSQKTSIP
jgi:glycosyltransferase involved in cell wall biosynthesis